MSRMCAIHHQVHPLGATILVMIGIIKYPMQGYLTDLIESLANAYSRPIAHLPGCIGYGGPEGGPDD
jgi:hypothetical protein